MVVIFNEDENKFQAIDKVDVPSQTGFANWLVKHKFVKTAKAGEGVIIFLIFILFVVAAGVASYGIGVNKIKNLEAGQSEYLER